MRVGVDATPMLGRPTGVGRYVGGLLGGLCALPDPPELVLTAFTLRGAGPLQELAARAGAAGVRVSGRRAPARALQAAWTRADVPPVEVLTGGVDVFHGTNFVLPPTRRAGGVVTVHDLTYVRHPELVSAASRRYADLVPRGLARASVVLTPSRAVAEEVVDEYRLDPGTVVATGLGVDASWFRTPPPAAELRSRLGLPERYLLFAGNLEPRKNLPVLLAAHAALRSDDADTPPLVLAGPPGWGASVDPAPDGVVLVGYLDDDALRAAVAGAACLVFPSRYEGFGLPPLEALASGVPVVASDLPVTREVLGRHAELVPPGDVDALADAVRRVLAAPPEPGPGRAWAARWTWQRCAQVTWDAYRAAAPH